MTRDGWTFAAGPSRTTAEVVEDLYRTIRVAAADSLVIGCNTVSHLSAGHFEICRIGDDTSGTEWPRTRKMGVNTLAFRGVQHGAFYVADADCVGVRATEVARTATETTGLENAAARLCHAVRHTRPRPSEAVCRPGRHGHRRDRDGR